METSRNSGMPPLVGRERLYGGGGLLHTRVEENEELDAGGRYNPEEKPAEWPELGKRIPVSTEQDIQGPFRTVEPPAQHCTYAYHRANPSPLPETLRNARRRSSHSRRMIRPVRISDRPPKKIPKKIL